MRILVGVMAAALLMTPMHARAADAASAPAPNGPSADATLILKGGMVSAGIGYEWGRGTLSYQGKEYAFCIRGLAVGEVGAADIDAQGVIFHMSSLEEFPGKYSAVSLGAAMIKGQSTTLLKNHRGVTMQLDSRVTGLRFNISASGVKITLAGTARCPADAQKR
jgi:hypothetical protein